LRIYSLESGLFEHLKNEKRVPRGNFFSLFTHRNRFLKFMACIGMGVPLWFTVGILMLMAKEFAPIIGVEGAEAKTIGGFALFWLYIGISVGDVVAGLLSQWWQSRRKVVLLFVLGHAVSILMYLLVRDISFTTYKVIVFSLGVTSGFWGLFATIASEQFGTNIRATVATTVPNFVRGCIIPITMLFSLLRDNWGGSANQNAVVNSALLVGGICIAVSLFSLWSLPETFGKDLDYVEE
jgi:putative MFS transporter